MVTLTGRGDNPKYIPYFFSFINWKLDQLGQLHSLKLSSPLKIGRNPKPDRLPSIQFSGAKMVSFREGTCWKWHHQEVISFDLTCLWHFGTLAKACAREKLQQNPQELTCGFINYLTLEDRKLLSNDHTQCFLQFLGILEDGHWLVIKFLNWGNWHPVTSGVMGPYLQQSSDQNPGDLLYI